MKTDIVPIERIRQAILFVRGQKVMLDRDLATLYGVETCALNQAVKRNRDRYREDFMFKLSREEIRNISQIVICSSTMKHAKSVYAFTEQGVAMLSRVLSSPRAIEVMRQSVREPRTDGKASPTSVIFAQWAVQKSPKADRMIGC